MSVAVVILTACGGNTGDQGYADGSDHQGVRDLLSEKVLFC